MSTAFQIRFRDDNGNLLTLGAREKRDLEEKLKDLLDAINAEFDTSIRYRLSYGEEGDDV